MAGSKTFLQPVCCPHCVTVSDPPSTKVTQKTSGTPTEGGSLTLTCDITDGRPRNDINSVTWKKGGQEVTSSGRNNISGRDLTISSLDHSKDDGSYTCAAENTAGIGGFCETLQLLINCKYELAFSKHARMLVRTHVRAHARTNTNLWKINTRKLDTI